MNVSVTFTTDVLTGAPREVREWIIKTAGLAGDDLPHAPAQPASPEPRPAGLARLSDSEARRFCDGLGDNSWAMVKAIVELGPRFGWRELMKKTGSDPHG